MRTLLTVCLVACAPQFSSSSSALSVPSSAGCISPLAFGATPIAPDAVVDATATIQRALDSAGGNTLCFPAGRFRLSRSPAGSYNRFAALSTHGRNIVISGVGPQTVLELVGDQGASGTNAISLDPGASGITIRDLTIDTSGMTNTDEQSHAIAIGTNVCATINGTCSQPVENIKIENVTFIHPPSTLGRKGDCVRIAGNTDATPTRNVRIIGSTFASCARSGVGIQRGVFALKVIGNYFSSPSVDQEIDGEATGGAWDDDIQIIGNTFDDAPPTTTQGDWSVALTSVRHALIALNTFNGRGLLLYRSTDAVVAGNVINAVNRTTYGDIEAGNQSDRLLVMGNSIHRSGATGKVIRIVSHSGASPESPSIVGNIISIDNDSDGIYVESANNATVRDNSISWSVAAPSSSGVFVHAATRTIDSPIVAGNRIMSPLGCFAAVRFATEYQYIDNAVMTGNVHRGTGSSVKCSVGTGPFRTPVVSGLNSWVTAPECQTLRAAGGS